MTGDLPSAVLFACTQNAIRSPMTAGLMQHFYGHRVYTSSVGAVAGDLDGFAISVMEEIGIDISNHKPSSFDELEDTSFDLIVSLSPEAQHKAVELTRTMACDVEYWPTLDPTFVTGSREQIIESYRGVRDMILQRIRQRFGQISAPVV